MANSLRGGWFVEIDQTSMVMPARCLRYFCVRMHTCMVGEMDSGCITIHAHLGTPCAFVCIFPPSGGMVCLFSGFFILFHQPTLAPALLQRSHVCVCARTTCLVTAGGNDGSVCRNTRPSGHALRIRLHLPARRKKCKYGMATISSFGMVGWSCWLINQPLRLPRFDDGQL